MTPYGLGSWCRLLLETCCLHSLLDDPENGGTATVRNATLAPPSRSRLRGASHFLARRRHSISAFAAVRARWTDRFARGFNLHMSCPTEFLGTPRPRTASGLQVEHCLDHGRPPSDPLGATVSTPVHTESEVGPVRAMKARKEEWRFSSMHSEPRHCMELRGQPHVPAAMPLAPALLYPLPRRSGCPGAGLDDLQCRRISCRCRGPKAGLSSP